MFDFCFRLSFKLINRLFFKNVSPPHTSSKCFTLQVWEIWGWRLGEVLQCLVPRPETEGGQRDGETRDFWQSSSRKIHVGMLARVPFDASKISCRSDQDSFVCLMLRWSFQHFTLPNWGRHLSESAYVFWTWIPGIDFDGLVSARRSMFSTRSWSRQCEPQALVVFMNSWMCSIKSITVFVARHIFEKIHLGTNMLLKLMFRFQFLPRVWISHSVCKCPSYNKLTQAH